VGSIPANPDAQNVPSFRRWRFEMKLSPFGLPSISGKNLICSRGKFYSRYFRKQLSWVESVDKEGFRFLAASVMSTFGQGQPFSW
jgi:hypothetical protein